VNAAPALRRERIFGTDLDLDGVIFGIDDVAALFADG
jgi:hypothetical protein